MASGPPDPPEKAGALIVRVWLEESGDPKLRIRMVGQLDLEAGVQVTAVTADIDEMLGHIRGWLERFARGGQDSGATSGGGPVPP